MGSEKYRPLAPRPAAPWPPASMGDNAMPFVESERGTGTGPTPFTGPYAGHIPEHRPAITPNTVPFPYIPTTQVPPYDELTSGPAASRQSQAPLETPHLVLSEDVSGILGQDDTGIASEADSDVDGVDMALDPLLASQQDALSTFNDYVQKHVTGGAFQGLRGAKRLRRFLEEEENPNPESRKIIKRGPRKAAEPTPDIKLRLTNATASWAQGHLDEAMDFANDAIRINGEISRSWAILGGIQEEKGELKQSLLSFVCAAHLESKVIDGWIDCSERADRLIEQTPEDFDDISRIGIMCYSQIIKIDLRNCDARMGRARLYLHGEKYKQAFNEYLLCLEISKHNPIALQELVQAAVLLTETGRPHDYLGKREQARDAFQSAIAFYQSGEAPNDYFFSWDDLICYIELLNHLGQSNDVYLEVKQLARWIVGRKGDTFWDEYDDDREWDVDDDRRRMTPGYNPNDYPDLYGKSLPLRLRTKLAVYRLEKGQDDEAQRHLNFLDPTGLYEEDNEAQEPQLLFEVATAMYTTRRYEAALRFFEPLRSQPGILDARALLHAGQCYLQVDDKRQAEECFTTVLDLEDADINSRTEARFKLATMYESARKAAEAYILVNEAMEDLEDDKRNHIQTHELGHRTRGDDDDEYRAEGNTDDGSCDMDENDESMNEEMPNVQRNPKRPYKRRENVANLRTNKERKEKTPGEKKPRRTSTERKRVMRPRPLVFALDEERAREEARKSTFMAEQWQIIRKKDLIEGLPSDAWMAAANELTDDFRSFKAFYPWDRFLMNLGLTQKVAICPDNPDLLQMAQRLKDSLDPQNSEYGKKLVETTVSYRNVPFRDWLNLFVEYGLALACTGRLDEAYSICEGAKNANVFFESSEDLFFIYVTHVACALLARDEEQLVHVARALLAKNLFSSDAFRMYSAVCRLCSATTGWYADTRVQKFILRQIKFMDSALLPNDQKLKGLDKYDTMHYPSAELDVQLLVLYGHVLYTSGSYSYALNYYVRAYAVDPDNAMINVSMGQAYVQQALKRQSENRQHLLARGFVFLHRYYHLRLAKATTAAQRQEAHYNLARTYHALSLSQLAIEYYKRVFQEVEGAGCGEEGDGGLVRDAAFNLQLLCHIGNDAEGMKSMGDHWLVL